MKENFNPYQVLERCNRVAAAFPAAHDILLHMIQEGEKASDFTLKNQKGEEVSLSGFVGKNVVLYFYPKDDTPGCTTEGMEFSALRERFEENNTVVLGVSKDSVESHKKFCDKYEFSIDLLSDEDGAVVEAYGAWQEKNTFGKKQTGIVRSTVLIDEQGVIKKHWNNVKAQGHAQEVLDFISSER